MTVKAIIFDLGGVIMDLAPERQKARFEALGIRDFKSLFTPANMNDFFEKQEIGKVTEDTFYDGFRELTGSDLSDGEIEEAWDLILTDFKPERMDFLEKLGKQYPIYLFSNTNDVHTKRYEAMVLEQFGRPLSSYFTEVFYSQNIGLRKPSPEAFKKVLEMAGLEAETTIFVDDSAPNIAGAKSIGLQTVHLVAPRTILDLGLDPEKWNN
ncbi:HAD family phosphatase [Lactovum odontotermitis]